jgi:ribokinase
MIFQVVGFGALNLDKLYQVNKIAREDEESYIKDLKISCGGSAANTLIGLSRLNLKTAIIGKIAKDREGELLLENLKKEGVNINGLIISSEGRSGNVMGFVDSEGQRALYVDPGVNDEIEVGEVDLELAHDSRVLHLTSFVGESIKAQEALLEELPGQIIVSFDPGRIYAEKGLKHLEKLLKRTNILLINSAELKLLTNKKYKTLKEEIESLRGFDIDMIVVKLGDKGCYATDGKSEYQMESFPVKCRDTTGAGDAFNAGFLYGFLNKKNFHDCCLMGNYVAACCVEDFGATQSLPDSTELEKLIETI